MIAGGSLRWRIFVARGSREKDERATEKKAVPQRSGPIAIAFESVKGEFLFT